MVTVEEKLRVDRLLNAEHKSAIKRRKGFESRVSILENDFWLWIFTVSMGEDQSLHCHKTWLSNVLLLFRGGNIGVMIWWGKFRHSPDTP